MLLEAKIFTLYVPAGMYGQFIVVFLSLYGPETVIALEDQLEFSNQYVRL